MNPIILRNELAELNRKTLSLRAEQDHALATGDTGLVRFLDREMFDLDMQGFAIEARIEELEDEANFELAMLPTRRAAHRRAFALIGA